MGGRVCVWHLETKAMLVIYVDDFKMACKAEDADRLWTELRKEIVLDPPSDPDSFLGCYPESFEATQQGVQLILQPHPDLLPRGQEQPTQVELENPDGLVVVS